ncbi:MAG: P-loop NTPase, partial [Hyphomicrobiales bacterium]|nr:P-loop NTPase [Hyphomicrobiales bacterium]
MAIANEEPAARADDGALVPPLPRVSLQAFCETPEFAATAQAAATDRRLVKAQVKVNMGGAAAAVEAFRGAPTPNVILVETAIDREQLLSRLDELAESCDAGTKVVVVGRTNDIHLYRELMARGVSEYLVAPISPMSLIEALSRLYNAPGGGPIGRVVAVTGAKGGVGASTVAHNLAWSISRAGGAQCALVDMDLPFGTAGLNFNQDPPQGVVEALYSPDRLDANLVDRLMSKCAEGLHLLASSASLDRSFDLQETAFDTLFDVLRATAPHVVLDVPHGWSAWKKRSLVGADTVVLVAEPDLANLRNAKAVLDVLRAARPHDSKPLLVMNRVGAFKRPEIPVDEFCKSLEMEATLTITCDPKAFGAAANNGQMVAEAEPDHAVAEQLAQLAALVTGRTQAKPQK